MTEQEIEKLREKLGSEYSVKRQNGAITVELVDIWKGVEFAESFGEIHKISRLNDNQVWYTNGEFSYKFDSIPSTESAYVEQLKAKAHELYGDIKDGDRFKGEGFESKYVSFIGHDLGRGFIYQKCSDTLHLNHLLIYKQGKWAKKVERVRVEPTHRSWDNNGNLSYDLSFSFKVTGTIVGDNNEIISNHLAQCLEDYLNKS